MPAQKGYDPAFMGKKLPVAPPRWRKLREKDLVSVDGSKLLDYPHHSIALSSTRKFPLFTAANIDGGLFRKILRRVVFPSGRDEWSLDPRARDYQWGADLYAAPKSDFDRGHLVKREDAQWGADDTEARDGARSTFFFTNCVPQVGDLNRKEWRSLEDYILKKESAPNKLKVNVFTGPVLSEHDPFFVHPVKGQSVQLPVLFWKVIYFTNDGRALSRVGFLMGQRNLLLTRGIARLPEGQEKMAPAPTFFEDYEDAATFQVNIALIESLTALHFPAAFDPYTDTRLNKIVLEEVEMKKVKTPFAKSREPGYVLQGLVLR